MVAMFNSKAKYCTCHVCKKILYNDLDHDEIPIKMCALETKFSRVENKNLMNEDFLETRLNKYAKVWNKFICSNLLPTSNENEVITSQAELFQAIFFSIALMLDML